MERGKDKKKKQRTPKKKKTQPTTDEVTSSSAGPVDSIEIADVSIDNMEETDRIFPQKEGDSDELFMSPDNRNAKIDLSIVSKSNIVDDVEFELDASGTDELSMSRHWVVKRTEENTPKGETNIDQTTMIHSQKEMHVSTAEQLVISNDPNLLEDPTYILDSATRNVDADQIEITSSTKCNYVEYMEGGKYEVEVKEYEETGEYVEDDKAAAVSDEYMEGGKYEVEVKEYEKTEEYAEDDKAAAVSDQNLLDVMAESTKNGKEKDLEEICPVGKPDQDDDTKIFASLKTNEGNENEENDSLNMQDHGQSMEPMVIPDNIIEQDEITDSVTAKINEGEDNMKDATAKIPTGFFSQWMSFLPPKQKNPTELAVPTEPTEVENVEPNKVKDVESNIVVDVEKEIDTDEAYDIPSQITGNVEMTSSVDITLDQEEFGEAESGIFVNGTSLDGLYIPAQQTENVEELHEADSNVMLSTENIVYETAEDKKEPVLGEPKESTSSAFLVEALDEEIAVIEERKNKKKKKKWPEKKREQATGAPLNQNDSSTIVRHENPDKAVPGSSFEESAPEKFQGEAMFEKSFEEAGLETLQGKAVSSILNDGTSRDDVVSSNPRTLLPEKVDSTFAPWHGLKQRDEIDLVIKEESVEVCSEVELFDTSALKPTITYEENILPTAANLVEELRPESLPDVLGVATLVANELKSVENVNKTVLTDANIIEEESELCSEVTYEENTFPTTAILVEEVRPESLPDLSGIQEPEHDVRLLNDKISQLYEQIYQLQDENIMILGNWNDDKQEMEQLRTKICFLDKSGDQGLTQLLSHVSTLTLENQSLQRRISVSTELSSSENKTIELQWEADKKEIEQLRAKLKQMKHIGEEGLSTLLSHVSTLSSENLALQRQLSFMSCDNQQLQQKMMQVGSEKKLCDVENDHLKEKLFLMEKLEGKDLSPSQTKRFSGFAASSWRTESEEFKRKLDSPELGHLLPLEESVYYENLKETLVELDSVILHLQNEFQTQLCNVRSGDTQTFELWLENELTEAKKVSERLDGEIQDFGRSFTALQNDLNKSNEMEQQLKCQIASGQREVAFMKTELITAPQEIQPIVDGNWDKLMDWDPSTRQVVTEEVSSIQQEPEEQERELNLDEEISDVLNDLLDKKMNVVDKSSMGNTRTNRDDMMNIDGMTSITTEGLWLSGVSMIQNGLHMLSYEDYPDKDTAVYVEAGPAMEHILAVVEISSNEEGNHGAATLVKQTGDIKDTKETVIDEDTITSGTVSMQDFASDIVDNSFHRAYSIYTLGTEGDKLSVETDYGICAKIETIHPAQTTMEATNNVGSGDANDNAKAEYIRCDIGETDNEIELKNFNDEIDDEITIKVETNAEQGGGHIDKGYRFNVLEDKSEIEVESGKSEKYKADSITEDDKDADLILVEKEQVFTDDTLAVLGMYAEHAEANGEHHIKDPKYFDGFENVVNAKDAEEEFEEEIITEDSEEAFHSANEDEIINQLVDIKEDAVHTEKQTIEKTTDKPIAAGRIEIDIKEYENLKKKLLESHTVLSQVKKNQEESIKRSVAQEKKLKELQAERDAAPIAGGGDNFDPDGEMNRFDSTHGNDQQANIQSIVNELKSEMKRLQLDVLEKEETLKELQSENSGLVVRLGHNQEFKQEMLVTDVNIQLQEKDSMLAEKEARIIYLCHALEERDQELAESLSIAIKNEQDFLAVKSDLVSKEFEFQEQLSVIKEQENALDTMMQEFLAKDKDLENKLDLIASKDYELSKAMQETLQADEVVESEKKLLRSSFKEETSFDEKCATLVQLLDVLQEALQGNKTTLIAQNDQLETKEDQINAALAMLNQERDDFRVIIDRKNAERDVLRSDKEELVNEVKNVKIENEESMHQNEILKSKNKAISKERDTLKKRNKVLTSENESMKVMNESLTDGRDALQIEKEDLEKEKDKLMNEKKDLMSEKKQVESERNDFIDECRDLNAEKDAKRLDNEILIKEKVTLIVQNETLLEEKDKLDAANEVLVKEKDKLTEENENLVKERDKLEHLNANLFNERENFEEESKKLMNECDNLRLKIVAMTKQKDELTKKSESLQKEKSNWKSKMEAFKLKKNEQKAKLEAKYEVLTKERNLLKAAMWDLEKARDTMLKEKKELVSKIEIMRSEKDCLLAEREDLKSEREELIRNKRDLKDELRENKRKKKDVENEKNTLEASHIILIAERDQYKSEMSTLMVVKDAMASEKMILENIIKESVGKVESLEVAVKETETHRIALKKERDALSNERDLLKTKVSESLKDKDILLDDKDEVIKTNEHLEDEKFQLIEHRDNMQAHNESMKAQLLAIQQEKDWVILEKNKVEEQLENLINERENIVAEQERALKFMIMERDELHKSNVQIEHDEELYNMEKSHNDKVQEMAELERDRGALTQDRDELVYKLGNLAKERDDMELERDYYKCAMEESERKCKIKVGEAVMQMQFAKLEAADKIGTAEQDSEDEKKETERIREEYNKLTSFDQKRNANQQFNEDTSKPKKSITKKASKERPNIKDSSKLRTKDASSKEKESVVKDEPREGGNKRKFVFEVATHFVTEEIVEAANEMGLEPTTNTEIESILANEDSKEAYVKSKEDHDDNSVAMNVKMGQVSKDVKITKGIYESECDNVIDSIIKNQSDDNLSISDMECDQMVMMPEEMNAEEGGRKKIGLLLQNTQMQKLKQMV